MLFTDVCTDLAPIIKFVKLGVFPIIQIGIPIILIVLGTLDLGKAVIASKEDEIKNAQKMLIKRAIYAVMVFFVVTIVRLVFGLFATSNNINLIDGDNNNQSWATCWDKY